MAMTNHVHRDALLWTLFSGMRKQSVLEMKWADVDLEARTLRVPTPKGGAKAAFDLPLSTVLVEILQRRQTEHALVTGGKRICMPWVWPSCTARTGHLADPTVSVPGLQWVVHDLRRAFVSAAEALD